MGGELYVFRSEKRPVSGARLVAELSAELSALTRAGSPGAAAGIVESALLRAGEMESLLADRRAPQVEGMAACADGLAEIALGAPAGAAPAVPEGTAEALRDARASPPEGFAYYGLQPGAFARLAADLPLPSGVAAVIGIRSIGTTLSAIVGAAIRRRGARASRTTVRPEGHPYDREVRLSEAQVAWIRAQHAGGAAFFVVDEGPGISGSSLLSAGEAVVRAGVEGQRVTLLCTRAVDPAALRARGAGRRFAALAGARAAPPPIFPDGAAIDLSGGGWRARFCEDEARWPATWPEMERIKLLSTDGRHLFKFEGLGRWGAAVRDRARAIAAAGFGLEPQEAGGGFVAYPVVPGPPLFPGALPRPPVARLADYCAFRAAAFPAPDADGAELDAMTAHDARVLLGVSAERLPLERPIFPDARLHPHEWIAAPGGALIKTDGAAHGDDHLFPGPTDVAWDLAGAVVEWALDDAARRELLDRYARASGDRADTRLPAYERAYLVAHLARAEMAAWATAATAERERLLGEAARYRRLLTGERARPGKRAR